MHKLDSSKEEKPVVKVHLDAHALVEIPQDNKTEFAYCRYDKETDQLVQCHQFIHCRDFLIDVQEGSEKNQDVSIYSFKYLKSYPRIDQSNVSLLVRLHSPLKQFEENFQILKDAEDYLKWMPSVATVVEYPGEKKNTIVWVMGDVAWQKSALSLSLYTYILKCLSYPIKDKAKWMEEILSKKTVEATYMDPDYMKFLLANLDDIVSKYKNFSGYKGAEPIHTVHNYTGFHSLKQVLKPKDPKYQPRMYADHILYGYKAPQ
jgi:hypothetical protein